MGRLGLEAYGISQLAQSALVFFGFLQLGMGPTLIRFCSQAIAKEDQEEIRKVSSTAQAILSVLGMAGMLGIIGFIPFFLKLYEVPETLTFDASMLLLCMAASFFLNFILIVPQGLSLGSNRYDLVNTVGIIASLLRFGLVVLAFEIASPSLFLLGMSILLAQVFRVVSLFTIAAIQVGRPAFPSLGAMNRGTLRSLFGFSVLNLINAMACSLVIQGPVLIIGKTLGVEVVALFAPAVLVATAMQGVLSQISSPLVPLASQAQAENCPQKMGNWSIIIGSFTAVVGLAATLPLCVFGKEIMGLWLGSDMTHVWISVAIMATGAVVSQIAAANYSLSLGGGCIRPIVYSQVVLGIITSVGVMLGTMFFGWHLLGIAVFITTCRCFRNIYYLTHAYAKQFVYSTSNYLWLVYIKPLLLFFGMAGCGFVVRMLIFPDQLLLLGVDICIIITIYLALSWHFVIASEIKSSVSKFFPAFHKW